MVLAKILKVRGGWALTHPSPTPHPHSRQLETILNKESSDVSPRTLIPYSWSPFSPKVGGLNAEVRRVRVNLININCPKEETIKLVFCCSKSGKSKSWKAASYWHEKIKAQIQWFRKVKCLSIWIRKDY